MNLKEDWEDGKRVSKIPRVTIMTYSKKVLNQLGKKLKAKGKLLYYQGLDYWLKAYKTVGYIFLGIGVLILKKERLQFDIPRYYQNRHLQSGKRRASPQS